MSAAVHRRILVVMAMAAEAQPLIDALTVRWGQPPVEDDLEPPLPMRSHHFRRPAGGEVLLAVNGPDPVFGVDSVATQPAALATHAGIRRLCPDLVLTVGTAGALPGRATIGEVFHVGGFRFHDRRIAGISDGFERYGIYALDAASLPVAGGAPVRNAVVSTGNALNTVAEDFRVMQAHLAIMNEIEGAADAWVAGLHGVPCAGCLLYTSPRPRDELADLV